MAEQVDDFLAHYGVIGMRWGKRNDKSSGGDKTPQSDSRIENRTAKREVKAQKFDAKTANLNTTIKDIDAQISSLPPGARSVYRKNLLDSARVEVVKDRDRAIKDAAAVRDGKLTSTQKKVIIGTSIVAGLTATYIVQDQIQSGNATRLIALGKERFSGEKFAFKKNDTLSDPNLDVDDIHRMIVKRINPDYGAIGTKMNCRRATFSYEMRRRGFDVKATKTTNANGQNVVGLMNAITPGEKIKPTGNYSVIKRLSDEASQLRRSNYSTPTPASDLAANFGAGGKNKIPMAASSKSIFDSLSKEPNGSRGELGVMWQMGGGHSMAYEIIKGKPVIFDGQTGKKFDTPDLFAKIMPSVKDAGFTRLDNVDLNVDYLMRWMTNV